MLLTCKSSQPLSSTLPLISLSVYFKSSHYCLGNFIKKVSKARGAEGRGTAVTCKSGQVPSSPRSRGGGSCSPGRGAAVPAGHGEGRGERSFTARREPGLHIIFWPRHSVILVTFLDKIFGKAETIFFFNTFCLLHSFLGQS